MADTGGERITDTFRFNHHAIPVPGITATDRILDATARLTAAIEGVQEAPPDELAAIQALRTLLLGEVPPLAPTPPPVLAPCPIGDDTESVVMWNPDEVQRPTCNTGNKSPTSAPPSQRDLPAIIEDDCDEESPPLTLLRRSPRTHSSPSTTTTHACLHARTVHMINCVIAEHVLTEAQLPPPTTNAPAH